jgi:hypothetical protein
VATRNNAGDGVEVFLNVEPDGIKQFTNKAILVDLRNATRLSTELTCNIPENVVQGSEQIEVAAIGDILGATLLNLDNLIRLQEKIKKFFLNKTLFSNPKGFQRAAENRILSYWYPISKY